MKKFEEEKILATDTLQYFYSVANYDRRINDWEERKLPMDIFRERVEEIQKAVGPIPDWMIFLFRGNAENENERRSFASMQEKRFDSFAVSLEQIFSIFEKKETFFEALADYYVPGAEGYVKNRLVEGDADVWYRECAKKGVDMADRVQLLHLCSYYEVLTHEAREVLIRAYRAVERLHEKEAAAIDRAARLLEQEDVQEKIRKYTAADMDPDGVRFAILLLNPYVFGYGAVENDENENEERVTEVVAGDRFLEGNLAPAGKMDQDFLRFVVACGNKFKIEAVSLILKNGSMTLTQLSEALGVQTAALIRPLTALVDDEILFREKKVGRSIYYNINPETYRAVRRSVMEFWKKEF